jgi:DHA2 family multidrug resistance protein
MSDLCKLINTDNRKWWIIGALSIMVVMSNLDLTALNIALPAIAQDFHASMSSLQWVLNTYILAMAMFSIVGGKLGDIFGHRKIFIIGAVVFALASLFCGLSLNEKMLIMSRAVQGIGAALALPMIGIIVYASFPPHQKGFAMGVFGATAGITQSVGPTLGGVIVKYLGWHWIFFVNLPLCVVCVFLTFASCPKYIIDLKFSKIDYRGIILLSAGLFLLTYTINEVQNWGLISTLFFGSLFAAICFIALFVYFAKKTTYPLIEISLFANKRFFVIILLRFISLYGVFVVLFLFVLCLQNVLLFDPIKTGLLMLFSTGVWGILSPIGGRIVDKFGARRPLIVAFALFGFSFILFSVLRYEQALFIMITALILNGMAAGIIFPATNISVLQVVPDNQRGAANGIYTTMTALGSAFGVGVSGTLATILSSSYLNNQLISKHFTLDTEKIALLSKVASGANSVTKISTYFPSTITKNLENITRESFFYAFSYEMIICALLSFICVFVLLAMKNVASYKK